MNRITIYFMSVLLFPVTTRAQNVGVGTESPVEKLDIAGNIKADTLKTNGLLLPPNAGEGKVLVSDANGNASWAQMTTPPAAPNEDNIGYGAWGDCETNANLGDYQPVTDTMGAYYNFFGNSVSISGNYAIVGCPQDQEGIGSQGSASIFYRNGSVWEFAQKLIDPEPNFADKFGSKVLISGNFAFVSVPEDDAGFTDNGSVCVFQFNGTDWVFLQKLTDPNGIANSQLGTSLAVSETFLVVGEMYDHNNGVYRGAVILFQWNGASWDYHSRLSDPGGENYDLFGNDVAIWGSHIMVGSYTDDVNGQSDQGSICFFRYDGTNWNFTNKLSSGVAGDNFGTSVAMYGIYAIVGSPNNSNNKGLVHICKFNGTSWIILDVMDNHGGLSGDRYGNDVCLTDRLMIISGYTTPVNSITGCGAATIFQRIGNGWQQLIRFHDPGYSSGDSFGFEAAIDNNSKRYVIGVPWYSNGIGKVIFGKVK